MGTPFDTALLSNIVAVLFGAIATTPSGLYGVINPSYQKCSDETASHTVAGLLCLCTGSFMRCPNLAGNRKDAL